MINSLESLAKSMADYSVYTLGDAGIPSMATVVAVFTLVPIVLYLVYQLSLPKPLPGIAYNAEATRSLWGDASSLARCLSSNGEFSGWLGEQCLKLGSPVCQIFVQPFRRPWVLVADFHEAQDILMRRPEFEKPQFLVDALQGLGDFHVRLRTGDDGFKYRRQLRQDLMTPTYLNNYIGPFLHSKGLDLLKLLGLKTEMAKGRPFCVREDFTRVVIDVMLYHAFGQGYNESALDPQLELLTNQSPSSNTVGPIDTPATFVEAPRSFFLELLHETAEVLERTTVSSTPKLSFWWWSKQPWYKNMVAEKNRVIMEQIRKADTNIRNGEAKSALDHMLMRERAAAEKRGREPELFSQGMIDEIFSDPMTGHHTTSSALAWVTKYLTGYPHAQYKLREELYSAFPEAIDERRPPTFENLRRAKLPYLEAVIEEARRLTPFVIVRETIQDTNILGRQVPKGTQCFMVSAGPGMMLPSVPVDEETRSATSRAAKPWGKWDESRDLKIFEPERWLTHTKDGGTIFDAAAGPQLGFGMGVRQCWGRRLAQLTVRTLIALVVWEFEMLEIPEELGGYAGVDGISREPMKAFARLRKLDPYKR